jgi:hypothetical protein
MRTPRPLRFAGTVVLVALLVPSGRALAADHAFLRHSAGQVAATVTAQGFQRADFFEDTPAEVALENERNPFQAWALAFFPTAIVKGATLGLALAFAKQKSWAAFLPIVPSMGMSHFYETGVTWAGLVALGGDLIGGALLTYYFNQYHAWGQNGGTKPAPTMLWAGISVIAVFFVYENLSAPLLASWQNKKLRRQFMPAGGGSEAWRRNPLPDRPLADIGPGNLLLRTSAPIGTGLTFTF